MSHDYSEKRDFYRMTIECPMTYTVVGQGEVYEGLAKDLSSTGMSIICAQHHPAGAMLEIRIAPDMTLVPALHARVEVVRSQTAPDGRWDLGVAIREFLQ